MEPTKPRRRWLKFSLGGLLLAITLLCLLLGWQADRVARQRRAVEMVERLGGYVAYEHQWYESPPFSHYNPRIESRAPQWLRELVGEEWFRTVALVGFHRGIGADGTTIFVPKRLTEAEWELVSHLDRLKVLSVTHQPTVDKELRHLARLTQLEELTLNGADISDEGLREFGRLTNLRELTIANDDIERAPLPGVTDRGLRHLASLTNLTSLGLGATHCTEQGIHQLPNLKQLETFQIGFPPGTQVDLAWLRQWPNLKSLILQGVVITGNGWDALAQSGRIQNLWFTNSVVSGDGLHKLAGLQLEFLGVSGSPISGNALQGLSKLTTVYLNSMEVNGEVLQPLVDAPDLHLLDLTQSRIGDEVLAALPEFKKLRFLTLTDTSTGDAALVGVNRQSDLRYLRLEKTRVTDAGLASLILPNLASVDVRGTKVTEAGAEQFRQRTGVEVVTDACAAGP